MTYCQNCGEPLEKRDDGEWKHVGGTDRCWLYAEPAADKMAKRRG